MRVASMPCTSRQYLLNRAASMPFFLRNSATVVTAVMVISQSRCGKKAAIQRGHRAGQVGTGAGGEKDHHAADILLAAEAPRRDLRQHLFAQVGYRFEEAGGHVAGEVPRGDGVDVDMTAAQARR